jgi:hypothetical protein
MATPSGTVDSTSLSTPKLSSSSLDAVPPRRQRHITPLPAVQLAHAGLMAALAQRTPHIIIGSEADRFDVLERARHLEAVLAAVTTYVKVVVKDTADFSPVALLDETAGLADTSSEIVAAFLNVNDRLQDLQAELEG